MDGISSSKSTIHSLSELVKKTTFCGFLQSIVGKLATPASMPA